MDPLTGLPDRDRLIAGITEMIVAGDEPSLFVVSIDGIDAVELESDSAIAKAYREVASRLSRLVRGVDVLASPTLGVFALAGTGIESADVAVIEERIRSAFALPTDLGFGAVALSVTLGFSRSQRGLDGRGLLEAAEADLRLRSSACD